jgi:type IV pilus assembly protein PilV
MRANTAELEAYQRAQALILVADMADRLRTTASSATDPEAAAQQLLTASPLGTGDSQPTSCAGVAVGPALDKCDWSNALKGSAEKSSGGGNIGAMIGAVGCVQQVQAQNLAAGVCTPAIFRITVAWQGLNKTFAPNAALICGQGLFGAETQRRVVTTQVTLGLPSCI